MTKNQKADEALKRYREIIEQAERERCIDAGIAFLRRMHPDASGIAFERLTGKFRAALCGA